MLDMDENAKTRPLPQNSEARRTRASIQKSKRATRSESEDADYIAIITERRLDTAAVGAHCIITLGMRPTSNIHSRVNRASIHALNADGEDIQKGYLGLQQ